MNKLYGTIIFFFYFIKYPLVIFLPILYLYLDYPNDIILNILYFISFALIIKDIFFPLDTCTLKNK
ncbi:MAG: hypothetical protein MJK08_09460 [Campylobacterales bacterium]|nr:hypothetical protein [Campylobacterales bacterium]NQY52625.1 hypothetical protein [Campylobacteraceae bacterium]